MKIILASLLLLLGGISASSYSQVLNVPLKNQVMNQWCWAATSQTTGMFYGKSYQQCQIVDEAARQGFSVPGNCCNNKNACNKPNYLSGRGGIIPVMRALQIPVVGQTGALSERQVQSEISKRAPFTMAWYWNSGGGHVVVGRGYQNGQVYWMDPWYGEGYKAGSYRATLSANNKGRWSATITTPGQ